MFKDTRRIHSGDFKVSVGKSNLIPKPKTMLYYTLTSQKKERKRAKIGCNAAAFMQSFSESY